MSSKDKGLENRPGQNNCFLNVCIQALWHLDPFRLKFLSSGSHVHKGASCIYCALKVLFTQYQFSADDVLPPTALRSCLSILYKEEDRFRMGALDDAAEALEAILTSLNKVYLVTGSTETDETNPNSLSNKVFGCPILERIQCSKCQAVSKPQGSDLFIFYSYATEIRSGHQRYPQLRFDSLLKRLNEEERKSCPNEEKGLCKEKKCPVYKYLLQQPEVFAIGLVWVTPNPSAEEIVETLSVVEKEIRLSNIFEGVSTQFTYKLKGMICYYGMHYDCYFYNPHRKKWIVFDDTIVKEVGASWKQLIERCRRGRFHPSVLFYERMGQGVPLPFNLNNKTSQAASPSVATKGPIQTPPMMPMVHPAMQRYVVPMHPRIVHPAYSFPHQMGMPMVMPITPHPAVAPSPQQAPPRAAEKKEEKTEPAPVDKKKKKKKKAKKEKENKSSSERERNEETLIPELKEDAEEKHEVVKSAIYPSAPLGVSAGSQQPLQPLPQVQPLQTQPQLVQPLVPQPRQSQPLQPQPAQPQPPQAQVQQPQPQPEAVQPLQQTQLSQPQSPQPQRIQPHAPQPQIQPQPPQPVYTQPLPPVQPAPPQAAVQQPIQVEYRQPQVQVHVRSQSADQEVAAAQVDRKAAVSPEPQVRIQPSPPQPAAVQPQMEVPLHQQFRPHFQRQLLSEAERQPMPQPQFPQPPVDEPAKVHSPQLPRVQQVEETPAAVVLPPQRPEYQHLAQPQPRPQELPLQVLAQENAPAQVNVQPTVAASTYSSVEAQPRMPAVAPIPQSPIQERPQSGHAVQKPSEPLISFHDEDEQDLVLEDLSYHGLDLEGLGLTTPAPSIYQPPAYAVPNFSASYTTPTSQPSDASASVWPGPSSSAEPVAPKWQSPDTLPTWNPAENNSHGWHSSAPSIEWPQVPSANPHSQPAIDTWQPSAPVYEAPPPAYNAPAYWDMAPPPAYMHGMHVPTFQQDYQRDAMVPAYQIPSAQVVYQQPSHPAVSPTASVAKEETQVPCHENAPWMAYLQKANNSETTTTATKSVTHSLDTAPLRRSSEGSTKQQPEYRNLSYLLGDSKKSPSPPPKYDPPAPQVKSSFSNLSNLLSTPSTYT